MITWILLGIILLAVIVMDSRTNRTHKLVKEINKKLDRLAPSEPKQLEDQ